MKKLVNKNIWEILIVLFILFLALFLSKFPTLYYIFNPIKHYWFIGHASWYDSWDIQVYLSYIQYGEHFGIFLQNAYTTIAHQGILIYQFYTLLGVLNKFLHISPILLFHLSSIIATIILILTSYFIVRQYFQERFLRLAAYTTAVIGGGVGWMGLFNSGSDISSAGFTTINAFERAHEAVSTAFLLLSLFFLMRYTLTYKNKYLLTGIILGLINCMIHPPFILLHITSGLGIGFIGFKTYAKKRVFLFPGLLFGLFGIYYLIFLSGLSSNPGFAGIVTQQLEPVTLGRILIGFGLLVPFLVLNFFNIFDEKIEMLLVRVLFGIQLAFLFLPIGVSIYFLKGLFLWGVIISYDGLSKFIRNTALRSKIIWIVLVSSLITRFWIFNSLMHINVHNPFFFLRTSEGNFLQKIDKYPQANVLSLYRIGNYIPAYSNMRVYYGHKLQTPSGGEKLQKAIDFYIYMDALQRKAFLKENNINYVYYGLEEQELRKDSILSTNNPFPEYKIHYQQDGLILYRP